jgi:hypothetical protein
VTLWCKFSGCVIPGHNAIQDVSAHVFTWTLQRVQNGCFKGRKYVPACPHVLSLKLLTDFNDIWCWEYALAVVRYISFWFILGEHNLYFSWTSERIWWLWFLFKSGCDYTKTGRPTWHKKVISLIYTISIKIFLILCIFNKVQWEIVYASMQCGVN